ncbi:hypothetical protein JOC85_000838 [Bacillus mesophilus]|uniref:Uncharacterized protein n=1 Tax=Bacillus mesophilus TaxID=1808955 RepID=A0A6M0QBR2_9BACI|nr:hypothetical protein [Bacillus mesophilus]MBM7660071.1 hypothetical protein [Bacillus mesophilus]NEY73726.1 hypothetical protein [Bacillus mesophilus]
MKNTSNHANDIVHKTVDTANNIVKSVSGEGGLVGKVTDSTADIVKNVSSTGNNVIGKTVDTTTKTFKDTTGKIFKRK